jgi:hypothetical protein
MKVEFSRSELIRRLISESLAQKERGEMELAMKEGYEANYGFIKESNKEWDFTSEDGISLPPAFGFRSNPDWLRSLQPLIRGVQEIRPTYLPVIQKNIQRQFL